MAGSYDQTSMSTMKVRSVFLTLMWRLSASSAPIWIELLLFGARAEFDPEQAEQRCQNALGIAAAEFRILVEIGVLDHLQQHIVRGDQARLAFDHHGEAGDILGARRQFAVDQLQFAGIDVELGGRGVFRRQALADRNGDAGADQRGRGDREPSLPQQSDQLQHAEAAPARRRRPAGPPAWPGLSAGHR